MSSNQLDVSSAIQCGACSASNTGDAKFCAGCGHSLVEPCAKCSKPVLLTQKFCGDCGADLGKLISDKKEQHQTWMVEAVGCAKKSDFDTAISLLRRVVKEADFRFGDAKVQAEQAIEKIRKLKEQNIASSGALQEKAEIAFAQSDFPKVIKLLTGIPEPLLTPESKDRLAKATSQLDEHTALHSELQSALKAKDWVMVGGLIQQLLTMLPNNPSYQSVGKQVSQRLIADSQKLLGKHEYDAAGEMLQIVPEIGRDEAYGKLVNSIEDTQWFSNQFDREVFTQPMLGRLAVRFTKQSPNDDSAKALVGEISKAVKSQPQQRGIFPLWRDEKQSWLGGPIGMLAKTETEPLDLSPYVLHRKYPGQLNVALGLALQGIGKTRVQEDFSISTKGLFASLTKKKSIPSAVWGLDIGSTAIRAVRMESDKKGFKITDVDVVEFENPTCRKDGVIAEDEIQKALAKFIANQGDKVGETPVWVNLSSTDIVNRFVCLPPVKDKPAAEMLSAEVAQRIPLDADDIQVVRWMSKLDDKNPAIGRPAIIAATRKAVAVRRTATIEKAGLTLGGIQSDSVAIANLVCFEFDDVVGTSKSSDETSASSEATTDASKKPAIAVVDCGAATTNFIVVSENAIFLSSYESGGEEITAALARAAKVTLDEADQLKRDPAKIANPAATFEKLNAKLNEARQRLQKIMRVADDQKLECEIVQTWCMGGGALFHGWAREVLLDDKN